MNGFVSFVLVFVGFAIVLLILSVNISTNYSMQIEIKKVHSLELDIKNTLLDLASNGANKAVRNYVNEKLAESAITGKPPKFDTNEMKDKAKIAAHEEMAKASGLVHTNPKVNIWCGFANERDLQDLRDTVLENKRPLLCNDCFEISDEACKEFVHVELKMNYEKPLDSNAEISLWSEAQAGRNGIIGISIYSEKPEIADFSYIPINEVR